MELREARVEIAFFPRRALRCCRRREASDPTRNVRENPLGLRDTVEQVVSVMLRTFVVLVPLAEVVDTEPRLPLALQHEARTLLQRVLDFCGILFDLVQTLADQADHALDDRNRGVVCEQQVAAKRRYFTCDSKEFLAPRDARRPRMEPQPKHHEAPVRTSARSFSEPAIRRGHEPAPGVAEHAVDEATFQPQVQSQNAPAFRDVLTWEVRACNFGR
mmetsp:Transcript_22600/g.62985  ORF Transcript_22600/g.62985 Transcript_22600/m.62985 type:complete len:217 (+) Transcript_22600:422-1072(+)